MEKGRISFLLVGLSIFSYSQNVQSNIYSYNASHYYESINLLEDGTFVYNNKSEFINSEIKGNWQISKDSILVLDSNPQKTKLLVFPSRKRGKKKTFRIRNMENNYINYHLYIITNEKDTIELRDQFDKTIIEGNFLSFYIVDSKGLHSPIYNIVATNANFFDIMVQEYRIFENEHWKYYGDYIIPLGIDNKYSSYELRKIIK